MECEINGCKFKYENDQLYRLLIIKNAGVVKKEPKWRLVKYTPDKKGYSRVGCYKKGYLLHRIIYYINNPNWNLYNSKKTNEIDHIDGDTSNNVINNLRNITHADNMLNIKAGKKGYSKTRWGNYEATINVNKQKKHLGTYDTEEEAHKVYLDAKKKYHNYNAVKNTKE